MMDHMPYDLMQKIEQVKYIKPDFEELARITQFAMDPDGYTEMLKRKIQSEVAGNVTRELRTAQGNSSSKGGVIVGTPKPVVKPAQQTNNNNSQSSLPRQKVSPLDRVR